MTPEREVREFLARWSATMERRDPDATADLFLRDPSPMVTFSDGERAHDWLDVRVRLGRDFERSIIERVELHNLRANEIAPDVLVTSFEYDLSIRDLWGAAQHATRHAMMTLVRTKDGFRVAAAHFSVPR